MPAADSTLEQRHSSRTAAKPTWWVNPASPAACLEVTHFGSPCAAIYRPGEESCGPSAPCIICSMLHSTTYLSSPSMHYPSNLSTVTRCCDETGFIQYPVKPPGCINISAFVADDAAKAGPKRAGLTGWYTCAKRRCALHGQGPDRRHLACWGRHIHGQHQCGKSLPIAAAHAVPVVAWHCCMHGRVPCLLSA